MSAFTIAFGLNGRDQAWYLRNGPAGFRAIDIAALPGPKPSFTGVPQQLVVSYTTEAFAGELLYKDRVQAATGGDGVTVVDQLPDWNTVKNVQLLSDGAQKMFLDGFVHVDAEIGRGDASGSHLVLNGVKRANVITGSGNDLIDIRMVSDQQSVWVDDFRIATGAGDDTVLLSGLDIAGELAAGDMTYIQAANKPGLDLIATGEGRTSYVSTASGDDTIVGYTSNDRIIAGTDDGSVKAITAHAGPSGFGYAVGGSTGKGGCASVLYKVDLKTGAATVVGEVKIGFGWLGAITGLQVESLAISPKDGQLYGFASKFGILDALVRIDPLTAKTTYIKLNLGGLHAELQDMAFDAAGNLFFVSNGDLLKVDTASGALKLIAKDTLDCKIGALAIDPKTGVMYGLAEQGGKGTILYEIDTATGKVVSTSKIAGLAKSSQIEGMSFDSTGTLYGVDRCTGAIVKIDPVADKATYVTKTLSDAQQDGDGFEAFAIKIDPPKLAGFKVEGGDTITTSGGADDLYYAAGDGVDTVTDFSKAADKLHIAGYAQDRIAIDVLGGDTYIRFRDDSADGYVDDAMILLKGVTGFDASMIKYDAFLWG